MDRSLKRKSDDVVNNSCSMDSIRGRQRSVGLANALSTDNGMRVSGYSRTGMEGDSSQGTGKDVNALGSSHSSQPTGPSENQSPVDTSQETGKDVISPGSSRSSQSVGPKEGDYRRTEEEESDGESDDDTMQDSKDESPTEEDEDMGDEDDEQGQSMDSLHYILQYVRSLELDRTVELEVRLAHHKYLRNLRSATKVEDSISMENRFEIIRKEKELNEFYAAQYSMKARTEKNKITKSYEQKFSWPKTYVEQRAERMEKRNKRDKEQGTAGESLHETSISTKESSEEDLRRHAAILEAQVNVLRDQNREMDDLCITLKDVAGGGHKEIEAAARLDAGSESRRRTIIPYRWNIKLETWEVAYHGSNSLISVPDQDCTQDALRDFISDSMPTHLRILGSKAEGMEEWRDQENEVQRVDLRPLLVELEESADLKGDFCWVPWLAVESMPYGLLGGEMVAERAALSSALVTAYGLFTLSPKSLRKKLYSSTSTKMEIATTGS
ncbi:hypothetical protein CBR_g8668 [Chara braunii]|uniref:Uncharacterized protein n=1 Tax=Chara braunii TaxID=69332 RepID=A0A388JS66_CHABU|nr:hypothetical protein CBR_g8668 [Chara braunii]|eukprot:GBG60648.1 hypothetical protein CBR_g8668 [Chara braunii]